MKLQILIFILSVLPNLAIAQQLLFEQISWTEWNNEISIKEKRISNNTYSKDTISMNTFLKESGIYLENKCPANIGNDSIIADQLCLHINDYLLGCFISSLSLSEVMSFNANNQVMRYYNIIDNEIIYYLYFRTILDNRKRNYQMDYSIYIRIIFILK